MPNKKNLIFSKITLVYLIKTLEFLNSIQLKIKLTRPQQANYTTF